MAEEVCKRSRNTVDRQPFPHCCSAMLPADGADQLSVRLSSRSLILQ